MQVNLSLTAAHARLNKMKEERDQFDEASNQIVTHFKSKVYCLTYNNTCKKEMKIMKF